MKRGTYRGLWLALCDQEWGILLLVVEGTSMRSRSAVSPWTVVVQGWEVSPLSSEMREASGHSHSVVRGQMFRWEVQKWDNLRKSLCGSM